MFVFMFEVYKKVKKYDKTKNTFLYTNKKL